MRKSAERSAHVAMGAECELRPCMFTPCSTLSNVQQYCRQLKPAAAVCSQWCHVAMTDGVIPRTTVSSVRTCTSVMQQVTTLALVRTSRPDHCPGMADCRTNVDVVMATYLLVGTHSSTSALGNTQQRHSGKSPGRRPRRKRV